MIWHILPSRSRVPTEAMNKNNASTNIFRKEIVESVIFYLLGAVC